MLAVSDAGRVYVTRPQAGDVLVFDSVAEGRAAAPTTAASNLPGVHGIALHKNRVYLAPTKELSSSEIKADGSVGDRQVLGTLPDGGQHARRTIGYGPDDMLYVSVGSDCNACAEPDGEHATMLRMRPDGSTRDVYAKGLRNTIGFDWHPRTGELWGMDNGSDWMGDNDPPEELNRLVAGGDYGWPFIWGNQNVNKLFDRVRTSQHEFSKPTVPPTLTYDAHAAPIGMAFYRGKQFPAEYQDDAFVAFHGSWNRAEPTGYLVARVRFRDGKPEKIEPFLSGFLIDRNSAYIGRPAGVAVTPEGSLLVSDDANGMIYRVHVGAARN